MPCRLTVDPSASSTMSNSVIVIVSHHTSRPDLRAHQPQVERHQWRGLCRSHQPRAGELLLRGVHDLVAPHEERPQRVLARPVAADQHPLERDRDQHRAHTAGQEHERRRGRHRHHPVARAERSIPAEHERPEHQRQRCREQNPHQLRSPRARPRAAGAGPSSAPDRCARVAAAARAPGTRTSCCHRAHPRARWRGRRRGIPSPISVVALDNRSVAQEAPGADGDRRDVQPAQPRAGGRERDCVGYERRLGQARQPVQAGADRHLGALADGDAEQSQPRARVDAQVQREQHLVGAAKQRVGEPQRPPRRALLRMPARSRISGESSRTSSATSSP